MTTSAQNPSAIFGMAQGLWPVRDPKVLIYPLDLTGGPVTWDFTREIMADVIEFIQSVAIDNSQNNTALSLTFSKTGHRIICPPQSQGIFAIIAGTEGFSVQASGPAAKFNLLFMNIPASPSVYKVT